MLSREEWHERYTQQAGWTAGARAYLYEKSGIDAAKRVLEVGCGSGVITADLHGYTQGAIFGIDLALPYLQFSRQHDPDSKFAGADARRLPFPNGAFDLVICHYFLLWVPNPLAALAEMARITRSGGHVLALAEPDYGGRIDYPAELEEAGALQTAALEQQGANPRIGRSMPALLAQTGLRDIESGVLGASWPAGVDWGEWESEWRVLRADLERLAPPERLAVWQAADQNARLAGQRVLFVPTFFASGRVN